MNLKIFKKTENQEQNLLNLSGKHNILKIVRYFGALFKLFDRVKIRGFEKFLRVQMVSFFYPSRCIVNQE